MREVFVAQPETRRLVAAEVREDDIGAGNEPEQHLAARVGSQVELDALLAAVEGLEEERVLAFLERWHVPGHVPACPGVFDLDDLRAELGELERRPRPGAELLDRENADVPERRLRHFVIWKFNVGQQGGTLSDRREYPGQAPGRRWHTSGRAGRDASATKTGLLGTNSPKLFQGNGEWRAFWTQQHGDNPTYELIPAENKDGSDQSGDDGGED